MTLVCYHVSVTYRCNQCCGYCFQFYDVLPCLGRESDITVEQLRLGAQKLREHDITVLKLRFTGGEPSMHPNLAKLRAVAAEEWKPTGWFRVYSNGRLGSRKDGVWMTVKSNKRKAHDHLPMMISPSDLNIPLDKRVGMNNRPCAMQVKCGRGFDTYGFSACTLAAAIGRLFDIPVHSDDPVLFGCEELCKHCIHSVGNRQAVTIQREAATGVFQYPTETFQKAIIKRRALGFNLPKRFGEG